MDRSRRADAAGPYNELRMDDIHSDSDMDAGRGGSDEKAGPYNELSLDDIHSDMDAGRGGSDEKYEEYSDRAQSPRRSARRLAPLANPPSLWIEEGGRGADVPDAWYRRSNGPATGIDDPTLLILPRFPDTPWLRNQAYAPRSSWAVDPEGSKPANMELDFSDSDCGSDVSRSYTPPARGARHSPRRRPSGSRKEINQFDITASPRSGATWSTKGMREALPTPSTPFDSHLPSPDGRRSHTQQVQSRKASDRFSVSRRRRGSGDSEGDLSDNYFSDDEAYYSRSYPGARRSLSATEADSPNAHLAGSNGE